MNECVITLASENDQDGFSPPSPFRLPLASWWHLCAWSTYACSCLPVTLQINKKSYYLIYLNISPLLAGKLASTDPTLWLDFLSSSNAISDEPKISIG